MQSRYRAALKTFGLTTLLISTLGRTAQAETMTLEQALSLAYETNPHLEAERAALRATDEDVAKALSGWRPTVIASSSYGYTRDYTAPLYGAVAANGHPRDGGITLTQPILNGSTIPQTRQAKAAVQVGRAQLSSVEQAVLLSAARAYFDVVGDEAELKFKRNNSALLSNQLGMTRERVAIRDITQTDLQLVVAHLSAADADIAVAQAKLAASRAAFLRQVGRPAETLEPSPPLPEIPGSEKLALGRALEGNSDLLAARELVRQADAAVSVATGTLLPDLSLQVQYKNSVDEIAPGIRDSGVSVVAQLRVPLYQAGAEYAEIRKAKELRGKAISSAADVERQVRESLESSWQAQLSARTAVTLHEQQVVASQSAYQGFAEGAKAGERTTFDLLNSAQELVSAQVALVEAHRQYYVSTFQLVVATGALTAKALHLPVRSYDPQIHYDDDAGRWIGTGN